MYISIVLNFIQLRFPGLKDPVSRAQWVFSGGKKKNPCSGAEIWSCVCFTEKKKKHNKSTILISILRRDFIAASIFDPLDSLKFDEMPSSRSVEHRENRLLRAVPSISRSSWVSSLDLWRGCFGKELLNGSMQQKNCWNPDLFPSSQRFMKVNWGVSSYVHLAESQFMLSLVLVRRRRIHQCNGQGQPTRLNWSFIPSLLPTEFAKKFHNFLVKKWHLYTTQKWPPSIPTKYDITYL